MKLYVLFFIFISYFGLTSSIKFVNKTDQIIKVSLDPERKIYELLPSSHIDVEDLQKDNYIYAKFSEELEPKLNKIELPFIMQVYVFSKYGNDYVIENSFSEFLVSLLG